MDDEDAELRRQIARDSVARLAEGMPETSLLGVPFDELDAICDLVRDAADELGVDLEMQDRIGDLGLVHLDIWRADAERSGVLGDAAPPKSPRS
jgi:hypothetical protein